MKKTTYFILGILFVALLGTVLHFLYQWSGKNPVVAIFAAVNESIWEHLKLLFWPGFLLSVYEFSKWGKKNPNFFFGKAVSFYSGILLIIILFYSYTGLLGNHYLIIDIFIFIISIIISQYIGYRIILSDFKPGKILNILSLVSIFLLILAFAVFSFTPPLSPLFIDPVTGTYGVQ